MSRRKRVQVGWYCDHRNEIKGSHVGQQFKNGVCKDNVPMPSMVQGLHFFDHNDPKKVPPCPLSEPVYVYREVDPK